ncbi:MAG: hypothetical protein KDA85_05975 [Planctomycetaceae bacterium]|nr:hypothetical protein [Planctomycetaceae bacterium]
MRTDVMRLNDRSPRRVPHQTTGRFATGTVSTGSKLATVVLAGCLFLAPAQLRADATTDAITTLKQTGDNASGAVQARKAMATLQTADTAALLPILEGFQDASPVAANWLRNAFEAIAAKHVADKSLPQAELLAFVRDKTQSPVARRLTYEWLLQVDATLEEQLIPTMLHDPGSEFRRDAVTRLITQAQAAENDAAATALFQQAMSGAVHEDQVKTISAALRKAGVEVDIQRHFGFLTSWKIVGPFDNRDEKGFAVTYPPEEVINLSGEYASEYPDAGTVHWNPITTDDDFGIVDIAEKIQNHKGSLMYATTTYVSDREQDVEVRLGTPNAWKLWINGQLVFAREEYHRSTRMDQYRIPIHLKAGPNLLLIKVCQNEQKEDWAQAYRFQLRICDGTGAAVLPATTSARLEQPRNSISATSLQGVSR